MKKFWNWIHDDSGGRVLRLEGPIDSESFWGDEVTPKAFRDDLYAEEGDITLWVNSPGGNVFAAAEIYTMLRDYPGSVTVRIASVAASAPCKGNGAVGAIVVTTVLNLQEVTSTVATRATGNKAAYICRLAGMMFMCHECSFLWHHGQAFCYVLQDLSLLLTAQHQIYAIQGRNLFRL